MRLSIPPSFHIGLFYVERMMAGACHRAGYSGQTRTAELVSVVRIGATIVWSSISGPHDSTTCMRMQSLKDSGGRIDTMRVLGGTACTGRLIHAGVRSHTTTRIFTLVPWSH